MRRKYGKILIVIYLLFVSIFSIRNINAAGNGSITITYEFEIDNNGVRESIAIPNATFDVYQVWKTVDPNNDIQFNVPFNGLFTGSEIKLMESETLQKQAEVFEAKISTATPVATGNTDANGVLVITNLDLGGYLIVQREAVSVNESFYLAKSFLVTIPFKEINGNWTNDVDIKPKASLLLDPQIIKLINNVESYGLSAKDEIFTYSIKTSIPEIPAEIFRVTDKLEPVLEFAPFTNPSDIVVISIDDSNLSATEVNAQTTIDTSVGKIQVNFTLAQLTDNRGKSVKIEFKSKIKDGADLSGYTSGKVPNDACFAVGYASAGTQDYRKEIAYVPSKQSEHSKIKTDGSSDVDLGPIIYPILGTAEKCSKKVYVYVPDPTTPTPTPTPTTPPRIDIPNTFAYLMEQMENHPWSIVLLVAVLFAISWRVYKTRGSE